MILHYGELGESFPFGYVAHDTSGSAGDGTSPLFDVRLAGAAADAAPVYSGSGTLLSHANYEEGHTEVMIAATAGNGFAAGSTYLVFGTETNDSQNPAALLGLIVLNKLLTGLDQGNIVETAIGTVNSTTEWVLDSGSDQDDAYNGYAVVVADADDLTRVHRLACSDYVGATRTMTVEATTPTFTAAVGDKVIVKDEFYYQPVNVEKINDVTVLGDGNATPFTV